MYRKYIIFPLEHYIKQTSNYNMNTTGQFRVDYKVGEMSIQVGWLGLVTHTNDKNMEYILSMNTLLLYQKQYTKSTHQRLCCRYAQEDKNLKKTAYNNISVCGEVVDVSGENTEFL